MRITLMISTLGLVLAASSSFAQTAPANIGQGRGITRDQFIQRASLAAAHRFDAIDVNHIGVITREQVRAWRQSHQGQGGLPAVQ